MTSEVLTPEAAQAERMKALGEFAGSIAHDFNDVLAGLLAQTELAKEAVAHGDASRAMQELEALTGSALRGGDLVRRLLGFSRRQPISTFPHEAADLVQRVEPIVRTVLPPSVQLMLRQQADVRVLVDVTLVEQVIRNLVNNSVDAMPAGGRLLIETRPRHLDEMDCVRQGWGNPGDYCAISVVDSGTGMSDEVRGRALDPFFTTKRPAKGTGLGLAMAYGIVKQHGGWIDITSAPGKGTRVDLLFPVYTGAPKTAKTEPTVGARGSGERIVLIEDDDPLREATARLLKRSGYVVRTASDGVDGLNLLRHWPEADLVLIDLAMPRLGGLEVNSALQRSGKRIPVLFITGTSPSTELPAPVLLKPWHPSELLAKVREVMDAGRDLATGERVP